MGRKKILYVITKSVWGGAQRYVFDLATNLPKDRFNVAATAGGSGPLFEKLRDAGIRTIEIPSLERDLHIYKESLTFWHLLQIFRKERPDVIHLNSTKIGILGALAAFLLKLLTFFTFKPIVVFTVHGFGFLEPRPRWQNVGIFLATAFGALFQQKIILLNQKEYTIARRFIPQKKLALIPLGITEPDFLDRARARTTIAEKIKSSISADAILIGTIAELTRNKGLVYFLDALTKFNLISLKELKVVIVGDGEDRVQLEKDIKKRNLERIIFLAGFIPNAASLLKGFDIFVLPSLKEGLPYTVLEAMAAGLPIAATNVGGIPDLITNSQEGLLVPPKDPDALSAALAVVIKDTGLRTRYGENGAQKVRDRFRLEAMVQKAITIYEYE